MFLPVKDQTKKMRALVRSHSYETDNNYTTRHHVKMRKSMFLLQKGMLCSHDMKTNCESWKARPMYILAEEACVTSLKCMQVILDRHTTIASSTLTDLLFE